jgi:hypothetical protein
LIQIGGLFSNVVLIFDPIVKHVGKHIETWMNDKQASENQRLSANLSLPKEEDIKITQYKT